MRSRARATAGWLILSLMAMAAPGGAGEQPVQGRNGGAAFESDKPCKVKNLPNFDILIPVPPPPVPFGPVEGPVGGGQAPELNLKIKIEAWNDGIPIVIDGKVEFFIYLPDFDDLLGLFSDPDRPASEVKRMGRSSFTTGPEGATVKTPVTFFNPGSTIGAAVDSFILGVRVDPKKPGGRKVSRINIEGRAIWSRD